MKETQKFDYLLIPFEQQTHSLMTVYIGSMKMRGSWAERPENALLVNVTSMQGKNAPYRRDFSPMSAIEGRYKGFCCFENYWQGYKRFEGMGHLEEDGVKRDKYVAYWKNLEKGQRRNPYSKETPVDAVYEDGVVRGYLDARKNIYIPQYYELMKETESFAKLKKLVEKGKSVAVFDFDGPRGEKGEYECLLVDLEMLVDKVNDTSFPFGHGYVIAGALAGFEPGDYC